MKNILIISVLLLIFGCAKEKTIRITSPDDYNRYLLVKRTSKDAALNEMIFWQSRLSEDSINTIALGKLSGVYNALFDVTGNISELKNAEMLIKKAFQVSARDKDTYLRSLAHIYITQHRFKEAKVLLDSAFTFPDNKRATELMLFDVSMELGDYTKADKLLGKIKNNSDYNYLIRLSKWSDYRGNLDAAIRYMEQAKTIAEAGGVVSLKVWTYSNIADYYGHAGKLKEAYEHYLMTLELQPDNAYAKKGIAWIVFASEKNSAEATRILDAISGNHLIPDYLLLRAEIAEFDKNLSEAKELEKMFLIAVENQDYGDMYNTYLIDIYSKINPKKALSLAEKEIANRATPETYQLLAYAQLMAGMKTEALNTIENFVNDKTFEPKAAYTKAKVYEANGIMDKIPELKAELKEAAFELGPVIMREVEKF
ncbi:MAG: tetratricopeptide (TPR) repeat protein [Sediminicola sp.]|jgi:tetratricopeptide (TPR) repeat protein